MKKYNLMVFFVVLTLTFSSPLLSLTDTHLRHNMVLNSNECSVVLGEKPVTIIYELTHTLNINSIILTITNLKYNLVPNSYFLVMVGEFPTDVYGYAIIAKNDGINFFIIRGSQNEWFKINVPIFNNVTISVKLNKSYIVNDLYINNIHVASMRRNRSILPLKTLIISLGNVRGLNAYAGKVFLSSITLIADNLKLIDTITPNTTYSFLLNETSIIPSKNRVRLICEYVKPKTITITKTYTVTTTTVLINVTTTTIILTTTNVKTLVTTIPTTSTITLYRNITINKTLTLTTTYTLTSTVTKTVIIEHVPWYVLPIILGLIIAIVVLTFILRR